MIINEDNIAHEILKYVILVEKSSGDALEMLQDVSLPEMEAQDSVVLKQHFFPYLRILLQKLKSISEVVENDLDKRNINPDVFKMLEVSTGHIENLYDNFGLDGPSRAYKISAQVKKVLDRAKNGGGKFPRQMLKDISRSIFEIQRLSVVYEFQRLRQLASKVVPQIRRLAGEMAHSERRFDRNSEFDIVAEIENLITERQPAVASLGIKFDYRNYLKTPFLYSNKSGLTSAIAQLMDNAIKFMGDLPIGSGHKQTWIVVQTSEKNRKFRFEIESWGTPITVDEYKSEKLFKIAHRGFFAEKSRIRGSGTGLYDVREVINSLGGEVWFETEPIHKSDHVTKNTTTTFNIEIPIVEDFSND